MLGLGRAAGDTRWKSLPHAAGLQPGTRCALFRSVCGACRNPTSCGVCRGRTSCPSPLRGLILRQPGAAQARISHGGASVGRWRGVQGRRLRAPSIACYGWCESQVPGPAGRPAPFQPENLRRVFIAPTYEGNQTLHLWQAILGRPMRIAGCSAEPEAVGTTRWEPSRRITAPDDGKAQRSGHARRPGAGRIRPAGERAGRPLPPAGSGDPSGGPDPCRISRSVQSAELGFAVRARMLPGGLRGLAEVGANSRRH